MSLAPGKCMSTPREEWSYCQLRWEQSLQTARDEGQTVGSMILEFKGEDQAEGQDLGPF